MWKSVYVRRRDNQRTSIGLHAIAGNYTLEAEKNRQERRHWHNSSSSALLLLLLLLSFASNLLPEFSTMHWRSHLFASTSTYQKKHEKHFQHSILTLHIFIISLFNFHCSLCRRYSHTHIQAHLAYNTIGENSKQPMK